jgi:hypothetical protein
VHSRASVRKMLEQEVRNELRGIKKEPKIVVVKARERLNAVDPSNLPYLHRNEAT